MFYPETYRRAGQQRFQTAVNRLMDHPSTAIGRLVSKVFDDSALLVTIGPMTLPPDRAPIQAAIQVISNPESGSHMLTPSLLYDPDRLTLANPAQISGRQLTLSEPEIAAMLLTSTAFASQFPRDTGQSGLTPGGFERRLYTVCGQVLEMEREWQHASEGQIPIWRLGTETRFQTDDAAITAYLGDRYWVDFGHQDLRPRISVLFNGGTIKSDDIDSANFFRDLIDSSTLTILYRELHWRRIWEQLSQIGNGNALRAMDPNTRATAAADQLIEILMDEHMR